MGIEREMKAAEAALSWKRALPTLRRIFVVVSDNKHILKPGSHGMDQR